MTPSPSRRLLSGTFLIVVVFAWVPFLDAGGPAWLVTLFSLSAFVLALGWPFVAVAAAFAVSPLIEGVAALVVYGDLARHTGFELVWIEPFFLGLCAGLLVRLVLHPPETAGQPVALRWFVAAGVAAFVAFVGTVVTAWRWNTGDLLRLMWWSIPSLGDTGIERSLRYSLILVAGPFWVWLVGQVVPPATDPRRLWIAWLGGSLAAAICGTWMWARGILVTAPRAQSLFDDVNSYASYLLLTSFIALTMLIGPGTRPVRALAAVTLLGSAWMLALSGSHIALFIAFVAALAFGLVATRRRRVVAAAGGLLLGVWLIVLMSPLPSTWTALTGVRQAADPAFLLRHLRDNRIGVWSATARAFVENPLTGLGAGVLYTRLDEYYTSSDRGYTPEHENAHNYFLQLAAETGVVGIASFAWLMFVLLREPLRWRAPGDRAAWLLVFGGVAYLGTSVAGHPLLLTRQVVLFWGFLAVVRAAYRPPERHAGSAPSASAWTSWSVAALVVTLLVIGGWLKPRTRPECPAAASARPFDVQFLAGFHRPQSVGPQVHHWMKDAGQVRICNRLDRTVNARIDMSIVSFARPRRLDVYAAGGRRRLGVSPGPARFAIPVTLEPGANHVILISRPRAVRVDTVAHNGDLSRVSVGLHDLVVAGP